MVSMARQRWADGEAMNATSCRGKVFYATRGAAERGAKAFNSRKGGAPNLAYSCLECGGFHIGRRPRHPVPSIEQKTRIVIGETCS